MCRVHRGSGLPALEQFRAAAARWFGRRAPSIYSARGTRGHPDDIPHEHLYGISFNATNFVKALKRIEGAADRPDRRDPRPPTVVSAASPRAFPSAQLVDGEPLLRRVRRVKTPEEVLDAIRASVRVAERSLSEAVGALVPGVTERQLTGVFMEAMASAGVTTPATQDVGVDHVPSRPTAPPKPRRGGRAGRIRWCSTPG